MPAPDGPRRSPGHGAVPGMRRTTPSIGHNPQHGNFPQPRKPAHYGGAASQRYKAEFPVLVALIESGHRTHSRAGGSARVHQDLDLSPKLPRSAGAMWLAGSVCCPGVGMWYGQRGKWVDGMPVVMRTWSWLTLTSDWSKATRGLESVCRKTPARCPHFEPGVVSRLGRASLSAAQNGRRYRFPSRTSRTIRLLPGHLPRPVTDLLRRA